MILVRYHIPMEYRSVADLNDSIVGALPLLPRDVDLIVGIPRSGLLAASILALHLNLPLTDVEGFIEGRILGYGRRYTMGNRKAFDLESVKKVLVLDDSAGSGTTMSKVREKLSGSQVSGKEIVYAAVYTDPLTKESVDIAFETCSSPRVFEWNIMHHPVLSESCVDIDGVLCLDPSVEENDDSINYLDFLANAKPLVIPTIEVGYLVTSRLEKYRSETEVWLAKHGVMYKKLFMLDLPDRETRMNLASYADFKAMVYAETNARLFIESSLNQSQEIANLSGKQVLCFETRKMINPEGLVARSKLLFQKKGKPAFRKSAFYPIYRFLKGW